MKSMRFLILWLIWALAASVAPAELTVPPEAVPPEQQAEAGPIAVEPQRTGDPKAGYRALVNQGYVSCGVPWPAFEAGNDITTAYTLPEREGRNARLPYQFNSFVNQDGVEVVSTNCLICHAAPFNGELIIGLGNENLDFTEDPVIEAELTGALIDDELSARPWRRWADRIAAIAPFMQTDTIGVNPAPNLTFALIAHRDPQTLAWSEQALLPLPPNQPLPISVPPWWRMQKKHAMFYNGMGRGDQTRFMMMKALVCTDELTEAQAIYEYFDDIRAYIVSLRAPRYPFAIDNTLAQTGQAVFEQVCAGCHGTYGEDWTYPNLLVPLEQIGTDPEYAKQILEKGWPYVDWLARSFYGQGARAEPGLGYVAPPLDGVWTTAPYLHNGSVPTIAALLDSQTRPRYWTREFNNQDYDEQALGWRFTALDYGKTNARSEQERKRIYDTDLPGYGNGGHTFGDDLSEAERKALLEYLKTL